MRGPGLEVGHDHSDAVDDRVLTLALRVGTDEDALEDVGVWVFADDCAEHQGQGLAADSATGRTDRPQPLEVVAPHARISRR